MVSTESSQQRTPPSALAEHSSPYPSWSCQRVSRRSPWRSHSISRVSRRSAMCRPSRLSVRVVIATTLPPWVSIWPLRFASVPPSPTWSSTSTYRRRALGRRGHDAVVAAFRRRRRSPLTSSYTYCKLWVGVALCHCESANPRRRASGDVARAAPSGRGLPCQRPTTAPRGQPRKGKCQRYQSRVSSQWPGQAADSSRITPAGHPGGSPEAPRERPASSLSLPVDSLPAPE